MDHGGNEGRIGPALGENFVEVLRASRPRPRR